MPSKISYGNMLEISYSISISPGCPTLEEFAYAIHQRGSPLTSIWAFIDGTARPICRPGRHQREVYNGHKRTHALKYQSVVTTNGLIANMFGQMEGRRHDSALLTESNLMEDLQMLPDHSSGDTFRLNGDTAYPLRLQLQGPFKGANLTEDQRLFNKKMSSVRECVEWAFGKVVSLFAFVDFKKNQKLYLQSVGKTYKVAVLMTNCHTCLCGSQNSDYFGVRPPRLEEYLA
ncbi:uncharacterized protein LOC119739165 isoform X2 [Patiria miniata]|uniref:DDE Tnp4 domain-containing protein n=1 Tax=Patiria miniata TaxID=46514 RepID=A0A914B350_PATMI|nr:uncharacterized protein LOC119739165 isoform X2 [Patiria miniata]